MGFAAATLLTSVVAAFILDAFTLDVTAILVFFLGLSVAGGKVSSVKWSIAVMTYYLVAAVILIVAASLGGDVVRIGAQSVHSRIWLLPCLGIAILWSAVNIALLCRCISSSRKA